MTAPPSIDSAVPSNSNYATYPSLAERSVFITGGADGIGRALVSHFARQGSRVAFADINTQKATSLLAALTDAQVDHLPIFYHVDLVDVSEFQDVLTNAIKALHGIEVLVNNAANDDRHDWETITPEYWDSRMNVNLRHYFFAIQAVGPQMIDAGRGSIINIGSSSYLMKEDFFPGYAIAKSAVEGLTRTMARTFGPHGIRVNSVLPGWVATERQLEKWWSPAGEEGTLADQQLKRRIYADEFVQMVLFLAADDGGACTAQQFLVDGGRF